MSTTETAAVSSRGAALDEAHIGDIRGALGTIRHGDVARAREVGGKLVFLLLRDLALRLCLVSFAGINVLDAGADAADEWKADSGHVNSSL